MTSRKSRSARSLYLLPLFAGIWACAPDALTREPEPAAVFGKPVTQVSVPALFNFPSTGYTVTNDGNSVYGFTGDCEVDARTFIDTDGTEDANMQMSAPGNRSKCTRRSVRVNHADGAVDLVTGLNVNDVGSIPVGNAALRSMNFTISNPTKCNRIGFGNLVGGDMVTVTRGADVAGKRSWSVSFNGNGACVTPQGPTILVPVTMNFTVTDK